MALPPTLHIIGQRNHGKTTLVVELLEELRGREVNGQRLRPGSIKHSGHRHPLDRPGKDSYRHQEASGGPSAIITPDRLAIFRPNEGIEDPYELLSPNFADCDLVIVEGDASRAKALKVEVWRAGLNTRPLAVERDDIVALVTDDAVDVAIPRWPRNDVPRLADQILSLLGLAP